MEKKTIRLAPKLSLHTHSLSIDTLNLPSINIIIEPEKKQTGKTIVLLKKTKIVDNEALF